MGFIKWIKRGDWLNPFFNFIGVAFALFIIVIVLRAIIKSDNDQVKEDIKKELQNDQLGDELLLDFTDINDRDIEVVHSELCPFVKSEYCERCPKGTFIKKPNTVYDGCLSKVDVDILNSISSNNIRMELESLLSSGDDEDSYLIKDLANNVDISNRTYSVYYYEDGLSYSKLPEPLNTISYYKWYSHKKEKFIKKVYGCSLDEWFNGQYCIDILKHYLKDYGPEERVDSVVIMANFSNR